MKNSKATFPMTTDFDLAFLGLESGEEITELRTVAYKTRYGDRVDVKAIRYNPELHHTLNLGVRERAKGRSIGRLVSAYRLDIVTERDWLHGVLQTRQTASKAPELFQLIDSLPLPCIVGCRACTLPELQNMNLHFLLRLWAIKLLRNLKTKYFVSTFDGSSHWQRTLKLAGYRLIENPISWKEFLKNSAPPVVGILDVENDGERAERTLESKFEGSISRILFPSENSLLFQQWCSRLQSEQFKLKAE